MCLCEEERERERDQPWKVGGREPKLSSSNSTESILYFGICSAIMGFAILFAVLQIAYEDWIVGTHWKLINNVTVLIDAKGAISNINKNKCAYLVQIRPHIQYKFIKPVELQTRKY